MCQGCVSRTACIPSKSRDHRAALSLLNEPRMDIALLRSSFELVVDRNPDLVARFYDILFDRYPLARPLFGRSSRGRQEKMLTGALVAVLDHLEDAAWLESTLGALGRKHLDYG